MAITINGTGGIADVNGTAANPAITGADADTGVYFGTNLLGLSTNGTSAVYVNASQYIGINNTSPTSSLDVIGHAASNGYYNFKGYSAGRGYGSYTNSSGKIGRAHV